MANISATGNYSMEMTDIPDAVSTGLRSAIIFTVSFFIISSNVINLSVLRITEQIPEISRFCLINLSTADLLVGCVSCAPNVITSAINRWIYGVVWCQIAGIMHGSSLAVSIWTLALISVDRYIAILHPLRYNSLITVRRCRIAVGCFWSASLVTFLFPLTLKTNFVYYRYKLSEAMCGLYWEFKWFCIATAVYIPLLSGTVLMVTNYKIMKALVKMDAENPNRSTRDASKSRDIKAFKVLGITAAMYFTAWGPYVISVIITSFFPAILLPMWLRFFVMWLANSNSFMDVIIYSVLYSSFRKNVWKLIKMCFSFGFIKSRRDQVHPIT